METTIAQPSAPLTYGPMLDLGELVDLFSPQNVQPFTPPRPGIDNLGITSTDTFYLRGRGEFRVNFSGYVRVARSEPTAPDWNHAEVYTNLIELCMVGDAGELGPIVVTLNPGYLSAGALWTPFADAESPQPEKACKMNVKAVFDVPRVGLRLYNKEAIVLTIDHVRAIPPAGNPGLGRIYQRLPLFNYAERDDPRARPTADITALEFAMGTYLSEEELNSLRAQRAALLEMPKS